MSNVGGIASWYGSFRMGAAQVGRELAGCSWVGIPFGGGMCEAAHIDARTVVVGDIHPHLINLASVAAHPVLGPKLYRHLRRVPFHPAELAAAQARCGEREAVGVSGLFVGMRAAAAEPDLRWAIDYFCVAWMTRHGSAGTAGEFKAGQSVRWNAGGGDSAAHFRGAVRSLIDWRRQAQGKLNFVCMDAFDFLAKVKDEPGVGVYCDAPFPGPGDGYKFRLPDAGHRRLAEAVGRFKAARCVLRFYDHSLIRELYPETRWTWLRVAGRKQTNEAGADVLIINGKAKSNEVAA